MASIDEFLKKYSSLSKSASDDKDKDDKKEKSDKEKEDDKKKEKSDKEKSDKEKEDDKKKDDKDEDEKEKSASERLESIYNRAVNGGVDKNSLADLNALALIEAVNIKTASEMMNKSAGIATEVKGAGEAVKTMLGMGKDKIVSGAKAVDEAAIGLGRRMNPGKPEIQEISKSIPVAQGVNTRVIETPFSPAEPISDNHARALGYGVPAAGIAGLSAAAGFTVKHIADAKAAQAAVRASQEAQAIAQTASNEINAEVGYAKSFGNKMQGVVDSVKNTINQGKDLISKNKFPLMAAGATIAGGVGAYELIKKQKDASIEKSASAYVESVWNDLLAFNLSEEAKNFEGYVLNKTASIEKSASTYVESVWNDLFAFNLSEEAKNFENLVIGKGIK